jgi:hypothetical protein
MINFDGARLQLSYSRLGQTRGVMVHKFICSGTFEERIRDMLASKGELRSARATAVTINTCTAARSISLLIFFWA